MEKEEVIRKGPWTEQEDAQLVFYVNLFGDRRWDFIAKVSGLKRTGKSGRLRWVNYLHPGLKRGKMTPHEERLILDLHAKWGNRWSRIARKIPGRTDNEIKNYWRTHTRKKTQDQKKKATPQTSSSSSISSSSSTAAKGRSFYDTGGILDSFTAPTTAAAVEDSTKVYSMDEIWKDIELSEESSNFNSSPPWDFCQADSLWSMDETESKMLMQNMAAPFNSFPAFYNITD